MNNPRIEFLKSQIGKPIENFRSPLGNWLNGTLISVSEEEIVISFKIRKEMTNPLGILHGGAAAAIMDDIMGASVFALNKEYIYVTTNLNVDFLDNAKEGEIIYAKTKVIRNGKTLINVECQIQNNGGKILVKGSSNLVATQLKSL